LRWPTGASTGFYACWARIHEEEVDVMDTGLLVLRLVVGLLLVGHGTQKLFGWFGGGGLNGTAWFFRSRGYRPPRFMAGLAGTAEVVGGAALAVGLLTPLAAALVIGTMLNAAVIHWRNGLWVVDNGCEYPLVIAAVAITLSFTGAGATSLDALLGLGGARGAGLPAVVLGLAAGSAVLLSRVVSGTAARDQHKVPTQRSALVRIGGSL
jgi:putative oxidoreductase